MKSKREICFQAARELSRKIHTCVAQLLCLLTHFVYIDESAGILRSGLYASSFHRYLSIPGYTFNNISHSKSPGFLRNRKELLIIMFPTGPMWTSPHSPQRGRLLTEAAFRLSLGSLLYCRHQVSY